MADEQKESLPFDEEVLRQGLDEKTEMPEPFGAQSSSDVEGNGLDGAERFETGPQESMEVGTDQPDAAASSVLTEKYKAIHRAVSFSQSRGEGDIGRRQKWLIAVAIGVIAVSLAGFTASNWMARQRMGELAAQIKKMEIRLDRITKQDTNHRKPERGIRLTALSKQPNESEIRQLKAQVLAIEQSIAVLNQSIQDMRRPVSKAGEAVTLKTEPAQSGKHANTKKLLPVMSEKNNSREVKQKSVWVVNLISLSNEETAEKRLGKIRKAGILARKHKVTVRGKTFYRLSTGCFKDISGARAYIRGIAIKAGYVNAWPSQETLSCLYTGKKEPGHAPFT